MQRARLFTAWDGTFSLASGRSLARFGVPALLALLLFGASAVILQNPKVAIWDQARLLEARFEAPYYPALPFGFTSQLLVIALRALLPAGAPLHEMLRLVAMAFWAGSAAWLATALLERRALVAVFLTLLFTSQYPFLWLSSELITGGFLCLAIGAWVRGASPWLVGPLLALLGLCKMELLLVSGLLVVVAVCDSHVETFCTGGGLFLWVGRPKPTMARCVGRTSFWASRTRCGRRSATCTLPCA